jgi:hypothetical protein
MEEAMIGLGASITQFSGDIWVWFLSFLILIIITTVLFLVAMRYGSASIISLNLSLYGGYALYTLFPYRDNFINIGTTPIAQAILALLLFGIATAGPVIISLRLTSPSFGSLSILQHFVLAFLAAGFLMALGYHLFDLNKIYTFSEPLNALFEPKGYFFWWFVSPLVGLYFVAR